MGRWKGHGVNTYLHRFSVHASCCACSLFYLVLLFLSLLPTRACEKGRSKCEKKYGIVDLSDLA
jgi:hypothetical protein